MRSTMSITMINSYHLGRFIPAICLLVSELASSRVESLSHVNQELGHARWCEVGRSPKGDSATLSRLGKAVGTCAGSGCSQPSRQHVAGIRLVKSSGYPLIISFINNAIHEVNSIHC